MKQIHIVWSNNHVLHIQIQGSKWKFTSPLRGYSQKQKQKQKQSKPNQTKPNGTLILHFSNYYLNTSLIFLTPNQNQNQNQNHNTSISQHISCVAGTHTSICLCKQRPLCCGSQPFFFYPSMVKELPAATEVHNKKHVIHVIILMEFIPKSTTISFANQMGVYTNTIYYLGCGHQDDPCAGFPCT